MLSHVVWRCSGRNGSGGGSVAIGRVHVSGRACSRTSCGGAVQSTTVALLLVVVVQVYRRGIISGYNDTQRRPLAHLRQFLPVPVIDKLLYRMTFADEVPIQ